MHEEKKWCVYQHTCLATNKHYIGITSQPPEQRWQQGNGYKKNTYFYRAICKYGWDGFQHSVLFVNLNKTEAERLEIELISRYKTTHSDFGFNIQHGGNVLGTHSESTKRKIGAKHKNKIVAQTTRDKISKSRSGTVASQETKAKLREHRRTLAKPIAQVSSSGVLVRVWGSVTELNRVLNYDSKAIRECCQKSNPKRKTAYGYIWMYEPEFQVWDGDVSEYSTIFRSKIREVVMYDKNMIEISRFPNCSVAGRTLNIPQQNINRCCNNLGNTAGGYIWKFAEDMVT